MDATGVNSFDVLADGQGKDDFRSSLAVIMNKELGWLVSLCLKIPINNKLRCVCPSLWRGVKERNCDVEIECVVE
ncbi:hypothetical protein HNY73_022816 [Argiope bruennichi]|uniref:Uncharacterized protein n=1 Tax=Argiope bruennichi TaxID=94029 RepID=A0A8T0E5R7_ARGBR|nr:hypothetical protein HNY73_022816 [Argiope bruennichi]